MRFFNHFTESEAGISPFEAVDKVLCCLMVGALHAAPNSIINGLNRVEHVRPLPV
jgi:hypothetical protein